MKIVQNVEEFYKDLKAVKVAKIADFLNVKLMSVIVDVGNCARCKEDHTEVSFSKLTYPHEDYTYWAACPTNKEPILMKIMEQNEQ